MIISGNIVDLYQRKIFHGRITVSDGKISRIESLEGQGKQYIMPGFIDSHIHIESSMLVPSEFSRMACRHGTVATVSDPHEIANVLGEEGVYYMIKNARAAALKFHFGAPSCVPATTFETSGASLDAQAVRTMLARPDIYFLSEVMNYPGVIDQDPMVWQKISAAKALNKPMDGHAPALWGSSASKYFGSGISTDHECFTYEEAKEKALLGVKILIREGSAAQNYAALHRLISEFPDQIMFCTDDLHPDDLLEGHMNKIVARAIADQHDLFDVLRAACINPVEHYRLPVGTMHIGDPADFIVVRDLTDFHVLQTYIEGSLVAENGRSLEKSRRSEEVNRFKCHRKDPSEFNIVKSNSTNPLPCIQAIDRELITKRIDVKLSADPNGHLIPDTGRDILLLTVVNRYRQAPPAMALVHGFGLREGALASSVAHDSHNIIAVGVSARQLCQAVNSIIDCRGGIAAVSDHSTNVIPLPIAGIMSNQKGESVAEQYQQLDGFAKQVLGSRLSSPFMILSFMSLLVIPQLKLSDRGLFDVERFNFV